MSRMLKKILLLIFIPVLTFCADFGLGVSVPKYGLKASMFQKNYIVEYSLTFTDVAINIIGDKPDEIINQSLFFKYITNLRTKKWTPVVGLGVIYSHYSKEYEYDNSTQGGSLFAVGASVGNYYTYSKKIRPFIEFNVGYPISFKKDNPTEYDDIELIPFIPKIGVIYLF